jgi:molybdenum cofactor guanylyltransferase
VNEVRAAAPTGPRAGIVLAGGRSTRFGSDKLAADRGGRPLVHLAIEALAAVCGEVIVVVSATGVPLLPADLGVPIRLCRDRAPDGGPLVGLIAGLQETLASTIVVVGGDMPGLVPAVLTDLLDRLRAGTDAAALLEGDALRPLPSAMVRDVALAAALALPTGRSGIRDLLARLRTERVPEADWKRLDPAGASLLDVDRPEDLARLD